ncbi:MAG: hypothetical protein ACJ8GV_07245 [Luteimonas sp.]
MDQHLPHPRIYFDGNAQLADLAYMLVRGALDDLRALGFTPEMAIGLRFSFVQEDVGHSGNADALTFNGTIAHSDSLGHYVLADPGGARWLSEVTGHDA